MDDGPGAGDLRHPELEPCAQPPGVLRGGLVVNRSECRGGADLQKTRLRQLTGGVGAGAGATPVRRAAPGPLDFDFLVLDLQVAVQQQALGVDEIVRFVAPREAKAPARARAR